MKQITTKRLERQFTAARDDAGVPQIKANDWLDSLYGLGFMHATDRLTQLLFARSVASGRAAEDIAHSPEIVETDRFFLRAGLHLELEKEVSFLDPFTREQLEQMDIPTLNGMTELGRIPVDLSASGGGPAHVDEPRVPVIETIPAPDTLGLNEAKNDA